jgi:hypothetical protein
MAYDPVLDREMFKSKEKAPKGRGIASLADDEEAVSRGDTVEERRQRAMDMLMAAKEKQDPANYQTLSDRERPMVFRPTAVNLPQQQQQPPVAQQMAQMQAAGIRPVGMAEGGIVQHFRNGGQSYTLPEVISNWWTGNWGDTPPATEPTGTEDTSGGSLDRSFSGDTAASVPSGETETIVVPGPRGPAGTVVRPKMRPRTRFDMPGSLPGASSQRGVVATNPPVDETKADETKKTTPEKDEDEKHPTGIEAIKAERARQREDNFNMALIKAGLAMMAGKSSNALANIGEGGISGLDAFTRAEKEDRALNAEQRKLEEDRAARLLRSRELNQEKALTRETRVYDIASGDIKALDTEIRKLGTDLNSALDEGQKATIRAQIEQLQSQKDDKQRIIQQSLSRLGYTGLPVTSSSRGNSTYTVGATITQNGNQFRVTGVDGNGRVTSAVPLQ